MTKVSVRRSPLPLNTACGQYYTTGLLAAGVVMSEGFRELSEAIQLAGREAANAASGQ